MASHSTVGASLDGAALRALLSRLAPLLAQPSDKSWQRIRRLLEWRVYDEPPVDEALLDACRTAFQAWPDSIRRTDGDWAAMITNPSERGDLRFLSLLNHIHGPPGVARLGDTGAAAFAAFPLPDSITSVSLTDQQISRAGLIALGRSAHLSRVQQLDLTSNDADADALQSLATHQPHLSVLRLENSSLDDLAASALAGGQWGQLTRLNLQRNRIGEPGARALAGAASLGTLRILELGGNPIGAGGGRALAEAQHLTQLEELVLFGCDLGDDGVVALAASPILRRVHRLDLNANGITKHGARALAASPHLGALRRMTLQGNHLDRDAISALRSRWPRKRAIAL